VGITSASVLLMARLIDLVEDADADNGERQKAALLLFLMLLAGKKAATPVAETSAITAAEVNFMVRVGCRE
jgi:hypothetical protein